jgi:hypothetical protein
LAEKSSGPKSFIEGRILPLFSLLCVGYAVYYFFFAPENGRLHDKYSVVATERIYVQPKPHGCAFDDAPLGDKHCHYRKHTVVYSEDRQIVERDGSRAGTAYPSCAPWSVEVTWEKIEE